MMTTFSDHFWGEKNNGFYVLYHNMKHGQTASKDFIDFLRESCTVEETYSKLLTKLARTATNSSHTGTFAPFWNVLKSLTEKLASLHMQLVLTWNDLIKDVARYNDEQHKRHKAIKDGESSTLEQVTAIQNNTTALHKAKELYHARCLELERLKRDNAPQKDVEKSEVKYKKASDDYKSLLEKYETIRNNFENKMMDSCKHFQEVEEEHICQMKDFIDTYAKAWENEHALRGQVHHEFKTTCDELTVQKLLDSFIQSKQTGKIKPGPLEFMEPDLSSLPAPRPMSPEPTEAKRESITEKSRPGFLKKNRKKEKKKKKKDKDDKSNDDKADTESVDTLEGDDGLVDEDGYRIRPDNPLENNGDKNSWNSSDSDSDSDDESKRKIKVEIRPLSPNGPLQAGTVDEIKEKMVGLRLSPTAVRKRAQTPVDKKMKRSQSESDTLGESRPSQNLDLLNLDFFSSSTSSTPVGGGFNLPSPLSPMADISNSLSSTPASNPNASDILNVDASDILNGSISPSTSLQSKPDNISSASSQLTSSLNGSFNLPMPPQRPPSRTSAIAPQVPARVTAGGRTSPAFMSRSESSSSVTFSTTSMPVGASRGPSPLTIGMSDTVPLAIAFTETINSLFRGTDATKCMVKITGNVMMSFPAGVVKVFTENPSPALLSFRIKNTDRLEQVLLNQQLVIQDVDQSSSDSLSYHFDMSALCGHLKTQGEENKTASYFNIDILKYQAKALSGVGSCPLPLVVYWKCEPTHTDIRLDYKFNPLPMSNPSTLKNISLMIPVSGEVTSMKSTPEGVWNEESQRGMWKLNDISEVSEEAGQGCVRAKFHLKSGPSKPATAAVQFICEGASLSGIDFELIGSGYRISLAKKRFGAGKYLADPDDS
ncbi:F-BAR domain only protein 2-like isoform X5 [Mytilus californianus]|uniref:F-BAR domain only protein 2-like isoform X5 n=1 Tax=Mytilus californianus TaxID=6549 RepID=UPI0022466BB2|nr:F-BAR domain only protein 2-like isoform X5 [Mytilus californianus]